MNSSSSTSSFIRENNNIERIVEPYNSFLRLSPTLLTTSSDQSNSNLPFYTTTNVYDKRFCLPPILTTKEENPMKRPPLHPPLPLTHIVSPEAIREAQIEESEEALFNQSRPFSAYPSFSLFKQHPVTPTPTPTPITITTTTSTSTSTSTDTAVNTMITSTSSLSSSSSPSPLLLSPKTNDNNNSNYTTTTNNNNNKKQQQTDSKEKLKRPPNAYLLFNRDMRRKLLEQSPKMTVGEISKEIGYWWKALPDDQRQFYIKEASLLKQEHLKKYPDFIYTRRSKAELAQAKRNHHHSKMNNGLLSDGEEEDTEEDESDKVKKQSAKKRRNNNGEKDPRGRKKKRIKHPFAPKHPMSAYLYYLASVYPEVSQSFPGSTVGPISKSISRTWHAMTKEERSPWIEKAESDKARYAREMQVYMASLNQEQAELEEDEVDHEDLDIHTLATVVEMVNHNTTTNNINA